LIIDFSLKNNALLLLLLFKSHINLEQLNTTRVDVKLRLILSK